MFHGLGFLACSESELTWHHYVKMYWGSGGSTPGILNLSARWNWMVSFTLRHFTPRKKAPGTHWIGGWVGPRAGLDAVAKRKIPSSSWELSAGRPDRSVFQIVQTCTLYYYYCCCCCYYYYSRSSSCYCSCVLKQTFCT
jgi:hypothetical protein